MGTPLETALQYCRRNWNPVPVPFQKKGPVDPGWGKRIIRETDAPRYFNGAPQNVGVVLGPTSNGLTDVDLDCPEAIALAPLLLPETGAIFGRQSKPDSHYLFVTKLGETSTKATHAYEDPETGATLVELRCGGGGKSAQTVFPGSFHVSGEPVEWSRSGEPAEYDGTKLRERVAAIAAGCLLVRHWPGMGSRHKAALALGGFLARLKWSETDIGHFVGAVADVAGSEDVAAKEKAARDAARAYEKGSTAGGYPMLADKFGEPVAKKVAEWLGYKPETVAERYFQHGSAEHGAGFDGRPRYSEGAKAEPRAPIKLHWHRDADPNAERAWLVRNLLSTVGKGLLSGQWGSAKTFVALDLCGSVMTGEPFAGRRSLRRGGVLFIAPEGAFEIPIRLKGLVEGKLAGTATAQAAAGEREVDPDDLPFAWIEECPRLVDRDAADQLMMTADAAATEMRERYDLPLVLIIVDTVAAGAGFDDENSAAETQKVMNALERLSHHTGAFVLGVDHFGKSVETGTRGSSAKEAAADTVLAALATRDEAGTVSNMRLAVRKVRGAPTGAETPYSLDVIEIGRDRWGDPVTTCVVNWKLDASAEPATLVPKDRWPTSLKVFRAALANALIGSGAAVRPYGDEGPELLAVREPEVRKEFGAAYPVDGDTEEKRTEAKRRAFKRALQTAMQRGLVGARELSGVDHIWMVHDTGPPGHPRTGQTGHS